MSEDRFPVFLQSFCYRCRCSCQFVVVGEDSSDVVCRTRYEACWSGDELLFFAVLCVLVLVVVVALRLEKFVCKLLVSEVLGVIA